jgi:DNA-binding NtrC family response regulator
MKSNGRILVVEPNGGLLTTLDILLKKHFSHVVSVTSLEQMYSVLQSEEMDVLLIDMGLCPNQADIETEIVGLASKCPGLQIVLLSTFAQADHAIALASGPALDYITKPWNSGRVIVSIKNALLIGELKREAGKIAMIKEGLREESNYFWGVSDAMKKVYANVHKAAYSDLPVVVTGEPGCGKEKIAREIHSISSASSSLFIAVDANFLPDSDFPAKLSSKIELAQDGILFINNADKLSGNNLDLLMKVIKSKKYNKIGTDISSDTSVHFILGCADAPEVPGAIRIDVPPLRERVDDIPVLCKLFLEKYNRKYNKQIASFSKGAMDFLCSCTWPGNVSELAVTVEKAVVLCAGNEILTSHLQTLSAQGYKEPRDAASADERVSILSVLEDETLEQMENRIIKAVLSRNRGNISLTAQQLGITRQTLYNKGKKYGLID